MMDRQVHNAILKFALSVPIYLTAIHKIPYAIRS